MKDDTISRQAAIATAISGRVRTLPTTEDGENWIRVNEVRDSLLSLPTAQPKRGKWIWVDGVRCSECNYKLETTGLPRYCPHCGADMRGEE